MVLCLPSELFRVVAGTQRCLSVCGRDPQLSRVPCSLCPEVNRVGSVQVSYQMQLLAKDKSRALLSEVLNLAVEEWERLCKGAADKKLLPAVFCVWCLQRDLLAGHGVAVAAQTEPPAGPLGLWDVAGHAGWCCFFRCFGRKLEVCASTPGREKMQSDLRVAFSMVQAGWALHPLSIQCVAKQVPMRAYLLLTRTPFWPCPTSWCQ